jgi:hypothetical protein
VADFSILEREAKRSRVQITEDDHMELGDDNGSDKGDSLKEFVQNLSEDEFKLFLKRKAKEILGISVDRVLDEAADKVMAEDMEELGEGAREKGAAEGEEMQIDGKLPDGVQYVADQGGSKGNVSKTKIDEAARIPEMAANVRSSPRLAGARNEHTLIKAGERMAKRNLELDEGMPSNTSDFSLSTNVAAHNLQQSVLSLNADVAAHNLQQIGFLVGLNGSKVTNNVEELLSLESERGELGLGVSDSEDLCSEDEEETIESLEANALKMLCGDLMEEIFVDENVCLKAERKRSGRKNRSHAKSCLIKTCKERVVRTKTNARK